MSPAAIPPPLVTSASAANRVIDTPELFESILLQLPLRKILVVQSVSKTFRDTIQSSPRLQKAVFLRSCGEPLEFVDVAYCPIDCISASDCDMNDSGRQNLSREPEKWVRTGNGQRQTLVVFNPFLQEVFGDFQGIHCVNTSEGLGASQSMFDMLLTQPPVQKMPVDHGSARHWHWLAARDASRGVTMGDLIRSSESFPRNFGGGKVSKIGATEVFRAYAAQDMSGMQMFEVLQAVEEASTSVDN